VGEGQGGVMSQRRIKRIVRIKPQELKYEEGAAELGSSPAMARIKKSWWR